MPDNTTLAARRKKRGQSEYTMKLKARRAACQVPGCNTAVPNKAYHQRYRICLTHAGMPQMVLSGQHVRFCQHCGRFQSLHEFDGNFKSCRKSLQRHRDSQSRRSRKSTKTSSSSSDYSAGGVATKGPSSCIGPVSASKSLSNNNNSPDQTLDQQYSDTTAPQGDDPLPSPTEQGAVAADQGESFLPLLYPSHEEEGRTVDDFMRLELLEDGMTGAIPDAVADVDWIPAELAGDFHISASNPVSDSLHDHDHQQHMQYPAATLYLPPVPVLPSPPAAAMPMPTLASFMESDTYTGTGTGTALGAGSGTSSDAGLGEACTLDAALSYLNGYRIGMPAVPASIDGISYVTRISLKLFNSMPEDLPITLRDALRSAVSQTETYINYNARPGCVHITAHAALTKQDAERLTAAGAVGLLNAALAQGGRFLPQQLVEGPHGHIVAQLNDQVAALGDTGSALCVSIASQGTPKVSAVVPLAMTTSAARPLTLLGSEISNDHDMVVCRRGEATPDLGVFGSGRCNEASVAGTSRSASPRGDSYTGRGLAGGEFVLFELSEVKEGLHHVEVQKGSMLSPSAAFLVLDDEAAVVELRQLEVDASGVADVTTFIESLGIVLDHLKLKREDPGHPNASPAVAARLAPMAAAIVNVAAARRWPAVLRLVAPAASPGDVEASAVGSSAASEGLTLLHVVAGSACVASVDVIKKWGAETGHVWENQPAGPAATTPLHIAAVLNDNGGMAAALTELLRPEQRWQEWHKAKGADGLTPAQLAKITMNDPVLEYLGKYLPVSDVAGVSHEYASFGEGQTAVAFDEGGSNGASASAKKSVLGGLRGKTSSMLDQITEGSGIVDWPYSALTSTQTLDAVRSSCKSVSMKYRVAAVVSVATAGLAVAVRIMCGGVQ